MATIACSLHRVFHTRAQKLNHRSNTISASTTSSKKATVKSHAARAIPSSTTCSSPATALHKPLLLPGRQHTPPTSEEKQEEERTTTTGVVSPLTQLPVADPASTPDATVDILKCTSSSSAAASSFSLMGLSVLLGTLLLPYLDAPAATAASEVANSASNLDSTFLLLTQMGDSAVFLMVLVITLAEMVPLVPTQPLAVASGLLFGAESGIPVALTGTVLAGLLAFLLSRNFGSALLTGVSEATAKLGLTMEGAEELKGSGGLDQQVAKMKAAVEDGTDLTCLLKVMFLRFSPVVPFSVSNYVMGLTNLPVQSFVGGTTLGMLPWITFYGFIGSSGRAVLENGGDITGVLTSLSEQAEDLLSGPITALIGISVIAIIFFGRRVLQSDAQES